MTQDSSRQPPNPDLPVNVDGYETVEPFGDYRDEIARRVALGEAGWSMSDGGEIEIVHQSDRIETVRVGDVTLTTHLVNDRGGQFDLRASAGDGTLVWRQVLPATATGVGRAAIELAGIGLVPSLLVAQRVTAGSVYRLLGVGSAGGLEVENLLDPFDDDPDPMLVAPYVAEGAASALIGPSGSTKSLNAVGIALALASGTRVGPHAPVGPQRPVTILDGEASRRDLREIAVAIGRGHDVDVEALQRDGLIRYIRIGGPIVGQAEALRLMLIEQGSGLLIVDSLDTARGADATNLSGGYYDTLRYLEVASLSVDHVTGSMLTLSIEQWRALGSVRSTNRPRQTWAIKAPRTPPQDEVTTLSRLNWVNRGRPGEMFKTTTTFEMAEPKRFVSIRMSEPDAVEQAPLRHQDQVLIAVKVAASGDSQMNPPDVENVTGLSRGQIDSALAKLRKRGFVAKGLPLRVTALGENFLIEQWPDGLPDPAGGDS